MNLRKIIEEKGIESFGRYYGVYVGIVKSDLDPENRGRLLVQIPQVKFDSDLVWALPMSFPSGVGHGGFYMPATNDWVYIQFVEGNPSYPLWSYGSYRTSDLPEEFSSNLVCGIKTLGGHSVVINDGEGFVEVKTKNGLKIKIDDYDKNISIAIEGGTSIELKEDGINLGKGSTEPAVLGNKLKDVLKDFSDIFTKPGNLVPMGAGFVITPTALAEMESWQLKLSDFLAKYT